MIEVAQEEAFDCQLLANEEKLVDRQRLSACCSTPRSDSI